jgi:hypothetical protein
MFKNTKRWIANLEDPVTPHKGCVVYCKLIGNAEHTGIYNGRGIVELDGDGQIREVSPQEFINGPDGARLSVEKGIYVSCDKDGYPLSSAESCERANRMIGCNRDYNLVFDNCHQFTCGCLSRNFENSSNFFCMMEEDVEKYLNGGKEVVWKKWNWEEDTSYNENDDSYLYAWKREVQNLNLDEEISTEKSDYDEDNDDYLYEWENDIKNIDFD